MLCLARSLFCCPKQSFFSFRSTKSGLSWFASLCSLIHLFMLMSMQSVIHIHTHTHTHIDETHNAPHTAHTNSHDICNCTACINNRHRQAHIDHDIQSTCHILPHIHNMCTQLITPCDRYSLQCCVSKHITTICVQPHHCCMHVAQAQLFFFAHQLCFSVSASTSQPQHVYNILCCWCILAILCVLMHCNVWLCMQCQALHTFQQDLLSCLCMHVE